MKCQLPWGQAPLFDDASPAGGGRRYRVSDGRTWGPVTATLVLAVAQARAVARTGRTASVWADDGTSVTVASGPDDGFIVEAAAPVPWAVHCRSLLTRHG